VKLWTERGDNSLNEKKRRSYGKQQQKLLKRCCAAGYRELKQQMHRFN